MKKQGLMFVFGVLFLYGATKWRTPVFAAESDPSLENKSSKNAAQWRQKMQDLYKIMVEITTDTTSQRRFDAPANKSRIEKNVKKLADRAHSLNKKGISPDADPTVKILSGLFQDETKRAYSALMSGNRTYARGALNRVSGYCIACHTRNSSGPNFSSLPLEPSSKNLFPIEQGRFYAATRQYDRALDLFQKIAEDPVAPIQKPIEWEQAIRYGLAIAVRVKNDPDQARALVERVIGSKNSPYFLKEDALKWRESIEEWKNELPRKAVTEEGLHSEAIRLVGQARELQKYPMDHSADILYLRATPLIHQMLQTAPDGRSAQDGLLLAGLSYEALQTLSIDDFHDLYYQACIRKVPHTPTAALCYRRYEQSTYFGYTGSAGTSLPEDIKLNLSELQELALPLGPKAPN